MSMFSSAKDIMKWLTDCAAAIAGQDKSVHWVTPLGLPIIQPYRRESTNICNSQLYMQGACAPVCTPLCSVIGDGVVDIH